MKKLAIVLIACMMAAAPAYARGGHGGWYAGFHGGGMHYHSHHHGGRVGSVIFGTIAGLALADAIVASTRPRVVQVSQPKVYIAEPENKCYTVVSRKKGTVTRQCVSDTDSDDIIYVD